MEAVKEEKEKVLVAEIMDKRPTGFILEGSEDTDKPVRLETSHARKLKPTSSVMVRKELSKGKFTEWEVRRIRYIKGCPTIFVDEQNEKGFKPNGANDAIWIENGALNVNRDAMNRALYDYILHYEGNASFPTSEVIKRPENALDVYQLLDTETAAEAIVDTFDAEVEALNLLKDLKITVSDTEVRYKEDSLEFLASLFRLPAYPSGYKSEVFVHLTQIARANPSAFLNTVANNRAVVEADVNRALSLGVITMDSSRAFFTDSKKLVMEFSSSSQAEQMSELVDFMANPKNTLFNGQMRNGVKEKQVALTGKK